MLDEVSILVLSSPRTESSHSLSHSTIFLGLFTLAVHFGVGWWHDLGLLLYGWCCTLDCTLYSGSLLYSVESWSSESRDWNIELNCWLLYWYTVVDFYTHSGSCFTLMLPEHELGHWGLLVFEIYPLDEYCGDRSEFLGFEHSGHSPAMGGIYFFSSQLWNWDIRTVLCYPYSCCWLL